MNKLLVAFILLPATVSAHDSWLIPAAYRTDPGKPLTVRFATSEAFPSSDAPLALDRVARFTLRSAAGSQTITGYKHDGNFLAATVTPHRTGHAIVVAETRPRLLVLKAAEFNNYLGHEQLKRVLAAREAAGNSQSDGRELYRKIAKTVLCVGDTSADSAYAQPEGLWLEIIPERSPCGLALGSALTVRVLFDGRPLEGAHLAAGYQGVAGHQYAAWIPTDKFGRATVRFDRPGAWFIRILHMAPLSNDPQADWQSAFSTLTLEVRPRPAAGPEAEIVTILEAQDAAWNRGDIEGFVNYYWKSGGLTFSGAGGVTRGWGGLLERYRRTYPDLAAMGKLSFSDLEIRMLAPDAALVLGRWRLDRQRDTPGGVFTLVVRKLPEGWRVVHDHTSSDP
jgi:uncharacterized GH25 family protein/ketosteroid isomerase-like protein